MLPLSIPLLSLLLAVPPTLASSSPSPRSSSSSSPSTPQFTYSLSAYSPAHTPTPPLIPRRKPPTGRFLHLTDLHPDPYYKDGASEDEACHFKQKKKRKKKKKHKGKGGGAERSDGKGWEGQGGEEEEEDEGELEVGSDSVKNKKDRPRTAGYWGLPVSDCDSPLTLLNSTFDWLAANFRDEVDFVVWTGDNARHDIDTRLPRSMPEIFKLNEYVLDRLRSAFGDEVTIVGSIGNNDIYPHNVMFPGPTKITQTFLSLWQSRGLIPEHHAHTFARGGYYSVSPSHPELHDKLLLVSLNTIYFYMRNTVVDGCPPYEEDLRGRSSDERAAFFLPPANSSSSSSYSPSGSSIPHPSSPAASSLFSSLLFRLSSSSSTFAEIDPGTEQLLWLEQQLTLARARGMQVWLTGHVPPGTRGGGENWYEGCGEGYEKLVREFGGTVVGQLFGHMNVDHFTFLTPPSSGKRLVALSPPLPPPSFLSRLFLRHPPPSSSSSSSDLSSFLSPSLPDLLFSLYRSLPLPSRKTPHPNLDDYSVVHVNPSVVPTYAPAVRVWEYNVSRSEAGVGSGAIMEDGEEDENGGEGWSRWRRRKGRKGKHGKGKKKKKPLPPPEERFATAPSRLNQFLTPLAYTQYFLPDSSYPTLSPEVNGSSVPRWEVEYTTLSTDEVSARLLSASSSSSSSSFSSGNASDPLLLHSALPQPLQDFFSSTPSRSLPTPHTRFALRRLLNRHHLTPYNGFFSSPSSSPGGTQKKGLVISEWVRLAHWLTEKEAGGREGERWSGMKGRMGVGTGEI
ncbi:hypothetical protein JCM11251_006312 [Rhodosporidiobolus azoricus]